jgi:hypothetical protein
MQALEVESVTVMIHIQIRACLINRIVKEHKEALDLKEYMGIMSTHCQAFKIKALEERLEEHLTQEAVLMEVEMEDMEK